MALRASWLAEPGPLGSSSLSGASTENDLKRGFRLRCFMLTWITVKEAGHFGTRNYKLTLYFFLGFLVNFLRWGVRPLFFSICGINSREHILVKQKTKKTLKKRRKLLTKHWIVLTSWVMRRFPSTVVSGSNGISAVLQAKGRMSLHHKEDKYGVEK